MKLFFNCLFVFFSSISFGQTHELIKLWETDTILKTPESALLYLKGDCIFVSNIDGKANEKDGKGSIGKVAFDGKVLVTDWVSGLNAPKGMGFYKNKLYVADLSEVVVIDIKAAKIIKHIPVEGATFLNDIAVDKKGTVYVSDTRKFTVHKIENDVATLYLDKLKGPNGLFCDKDILYVLDKGSLLSVDAQKKITTVADGMEASTDGLEKVVDGEFIVTAWSGICYYVKADGSKQVLFDNRDKKINSADIGFDPKKKIVYVPTFYGNKIVAYQLK